jgi:hypothetical protein
MKESVLNIKFEPRSKSLWNKYQIYRATYPLPIYDIYFYIHPRLSRHPFSQHSPTATGGLYDTRGGLYLQLQVPTIPVKNYLRYLVVTRGVYIFCKIYSH